MVLNAMALRRPEAPTMTMAIIARVRTVMVMGVARALTSPPSSPLPRHPPFSSSLLFQLLSLGPNPCPYHYPTPLSAAPLAPPLRQHHACMNKRSFLTSEVCTNSDPKVKSTIYANRNFKEQCLKETSANTLSKQKHGRITHMWSKEGDNTLYFCCRRSLPNTCGMR